jgi:hypothetical protein
VQLLLVTSLFWSSDYVRPSAATTFVPVQLLVCSGQVITFGPVQLLFRYSAVTSSY